MQQLLKPLILSGRGEAWMLLGLGWRRRERGRTRNVGRHVREVTLPGTSKETSCSGRTGIKASRGPKRRTRARQSRKDGDPAGRFRPEAGKAWLDGEKANKRVVICWGAYVGTTISLTGTEEPNLAWCLAQRDTAPLSLAAGDR